MLTTETQLFISSIGWALIHFLWQGTLITLAYWAITRNIKSVHAKYWTGMAMVVVSLLVPIINISSSQTAVVSTAQITQLSTTVISHQQLNYEGLFQYVINASLPYLVMIWAITVLFLSFRLARSWIHLAAIKHECDPCTSRQLKQYIKNIAIKLDLPTIPMLKISREVMVPAAYGLFKPTVLLPLSLISQIPKDQLEAIIKHELCHLKRNDFIHNIIQLCADILLFFHPGIRWMNNDIRHVREQCCDQMVLSQDTEKLTYAKALTNIAAFSNGMKLKPNVHLGINDGMLLNRVKFLLQNNSSQSSLMVFVPFLMLIIFMIIMLKPNSHEISDTASALSNSYISENTDTDKEDLAALHNKRMSEQSFYPKLSRQTQTPVVSTSTAYDAVNLRPEADLTRDAITTTSPPNLLDRNAILNDLKMDIDISAATDTDNTLLVEDFPADQVSTVESAPAAIEAALNEVPLPNEDAVINSSNSTNELASFEVTDSIKPKFKRYVAPEYPQYFWYNQIEQEVIATFKIQPNGRAYDIKLTSQVNNYVAFEQEVEKAMKRWKFDTSSLNNSTLQRTYQQIFSFAITDDLVKNCETRTTGTRLNRPMPCNK